MLAHAEAGVRAPPPIRRNPPRCAKRLGEREVFAATSSQALSPERSCSRRSKSTAAAPSDKVCCRETLLGWGLPLPCNLVVQELCARDPDAAHGLYQLVVSCFGASGELALMEDAVLEMARLGLPVDSATGNAFVQYYASSGTMPQMEAAYRRLKKCRPTRRGCSQGIAEGRRRAVWAKQKIRHLAGGPNGIWESIGEL
ncbi:hypothetical protein GUJ93_ZPchr0005g14686 [Zizania palustris]|uniref:Pentacotripeptide-repeat region of PRORP domain-containing protein n=1 Tax=Zizania palustris TaxID=103762 RepID=A0A8J5VI16_ZIZPA|nr:hypothetical protein GUJ93_ZPchr0005g14686 [Zizania palustris]